MKLTVIALSIALTIPAVFAQKYPKRPANLGPGAPASVSLKVRSLQAHPRVLSPQAAPTPAPIVVQVFVDPSTGVLTAFGIATSTIPSGTTVTGSMTLLDDNSAIDFQQLPLQQDLPAGSFIILPTISNFGDLWNPGAFDYTVQLVPSRGATTQAEGVFLVGETLAYADLVNFEPIIASATQSINGSKDVILALKGYYTGDPVQVVLSDLFSNFVVPSSAITVSATEIDVDMSKITGFDLASLDGLLVTVSEDNIADTVAFRYLPPPPGTYNAAPTQ